MTSLLNTYICAKFNSFLKFRNFVKVIPLQWITVRFLKRSKTVNKLCQNLTAKANVGSCFPRSWTLMAVKVFVLYAVRNVCRALCTKNEIQVAK
jgi:hypothetical protein